MSNVNFRSLVKAYSTSVDKAGKNLTALVDWMVAEGITVKLLKDKKSDTSAEMDAGIVASFPKPVQMLLQSATKGLSEQDKQAKRYGQQQIGSRRAKIIKALDARINPVEQGPDQKKTDDQTFCQERVIAMIKRLEKSDNAPFDIVEALTQLVKLQETLSVKI
tara:strand:- start:190 stop:678 length:489 start_codon:yes stop_codon:yes gene_type:complete